MAHMGPRMDDDKTGNDSMVVFSQDSQKFIFATVELIQESEYFRALLESGMVESSRRQVSLPCVTSRGLQTLQIYLDSKYRSDSLNLDNIVLSDFEDIIHTAIYLQMSDFLKTCEKHLMKALTTDNIFEIRTLVETFSLETVLHHVDKYLKQNISDIWRSDSFFKEYDNPESLGSLLASDDLNFKETEVEACLIIQKFLESKGVTQMDLTDFPKLVNCIRFPLVDKYDGNIKFFRDFNDYHGIMPINVVSSLDTIYRRALTFKLKPNKRFTLSSDDSWGHLRCSVPVLFGCGGFTQSESSTRKVQFLTMDVLKDCCKKQALLEFNLPKKNMEKSMRLPTPLVEHAVCVLNGYLYVAGGQHKYCSDGRHTSPKCYRFDPLCDGWTEIDSMNTSRSLFYLGALDGSLYAVCGWTGPNSVTKSVERYDVLNNTWKQVASVPMGLHEHAGCNHKGQLYASGGYRGPYRGHLNQVWCYDPTHDVWHQKKSLTHRRSYHAMASIGEKIYVAGGVNYIGDEMFEDVMIVEVYDPNLDQWSDLSQRLPMYASCMSSLVLESQVLLFGGHSFETDSDHNFLQIFDTNTGKFSKCVINSNRIQFFPVVAIAIKAEGTGCTLRLAL